MPLNDAALGIFKRTLEATEKELPPAWFFRPLWAEHARKPTHAFRALVDSVGLNDGIRPDDRARRIVFASLRHTLLRGWPLVMAKTYTASND